MRRCWSQDISKSHSTTSLTLKKVYLDLLLNVQFICLFQCYTLEMDVWSSDENDTETVLWYRMTDVFSLYHCHWQFVISFCKQKCKEMSGCSWHHPSRYWHNWHWPETTDTMELWLTWPWRHIFTIIIGSLQPQLGLIWYWSVVMVV